MLTIGNKGVYEEDMSGSSSIVPPEKQANERRVNILAGANNGQELILTLDIVYKSVEIIQYTIQTDCHVRPEILELIQPIWF